MFKISHENTLYFWRYGHVRYVKRVLQKFGKQYSMLKIFMNMDKVLAVLNFAVKALETNFASKPKFYIRNYKELNLLKIQIVTFLDK